MKRMTSFLLAFAMVLGIALSGGHSVKALSVISSYSVRVGNVTLPLPEYPNGTAITTTGKPCNVYSHDDCLRYYSYNGKTIDTYAWQCCGFARYVFWRCFGVVDFPEVANGNGYYQAVRNVPASSISVSYLKSIFGSTVKPGAHVRTNVGPAGYQHSMVYAGSDATYIYTYEGNFGNNCTVSFVRRTWDEMASYLTKTQYGIQYIDMPTNYPGAAAVDVTAPSVSNIKISEVSTAGFRVTCSVSDASGIDRVQFPTWTNANGQDDLIWHNASVSNGSATAYIKTSEHKNEVGDYTTHIYAYDKAGNRTAVAAPAIYIARNPLANGTYRIASGLNNATGLDVSGVSTADAANVHLWEYCEGKNQQFNVTSLGNGYYRITAVHSGKALDVPYGESSNGANVFQWAVDGTAAQDWLLKEAGDGYYNIVSVYGLVLDASGGYSSNGTNVQLWTANGTPAQKWKFLPTVEKDTTGPSVSGIATSELTSEGFRISCNVTDASGIDKVEFATWTDANGQDDLVWHKATVSGNTATAYIKSSEHKNETGAYTVHVYAYDKAGNRTAVAAPTVQVPAKALANGTYRIVSALNSNMVADVSSVSTADAANIHLWTYGGGENQKFKVTATGNGNYLITALHSGKSFDIAVNQKSAGANVEQWAVDGTVTQNWKIEDAGNGYYYIVSTYGLVLDANGGYSDNGTNLQLWTKNGSNAQKWKFVPESAKDVTGPSVSNISASEVTSAGFRMTCSVSDASGIDKVEFATWTDANGQDDLVWHKATVSGSSATAYIKASDHKNETGSYTVHVYAYDKAGNRTAVAAPTVQLPAKALANGTYRIVSALNSNMVADVSGVSKDDNANVHLWTYGGGANQKFTFTSIGNGKYRIVATHSGKALDVAYGQTSNGANVIQWAIDGTAAQDWTLKDAGDGYYYIVSTYGLVLDANGGYSDNGTNLQLWTQNGTNAQKWKLVPESVSTTPAKGYAAGYKGGMAGTGKIVAKGVDVSEHQGTGFNFKNLKNAGYDYVILRCGFVSRKDYRFEEYYKAAKEAGLGVGVYFYSYAENASEAASEAQICLNYIAGKTFEYPIYFDFEDPIVTNRTASNATAICNAFLSKIESAGYLPGLYGYASWCDANYPGRWVPIESICSKWEFWMANYYDGTPTNTKSANYPSRYGMYQYTDSNYVNGVGPLDTNVCYKDYPTIVKTYHFNGF